MKNDLRLFGTLFVFLLIVCAHSAVASANDTNKNGPSGITTDRGPFQKSPLDNTPISGQFTINQNEPTGGTNFNSFNDLKDRLIASGVNGPLMVDVVGDNAVYEEQLIFLIVPGASQTNNITINGNGNTLQFLSTNSNERATLKLNGAKFFTFNNLIIKALGEQSGEYGYGVHLMFGADHNSFIGCHIVANETSTSEDFMGIVASNNHSYHTMPGETAQYLLIDNCVVSGGRIGLALNGNNYPHFNYLTVTNTHVKNFHEIGIYLNYQKGAIISNNSIYRDSSRSIRGTRMIFLDRNLSGSRITNNRIFGFSGTLEQNQSFEARGISTNWLTSDISNRLVIANNLIYGFGKMSSWQFGIHIHGNNARIYHNSISLDSEALFSGGTLTGIYLEGGPANMDIRNNIIRVASLGVTNNYGFYFQSTSSIDHCNHNAIFVSGPNAHVAKVNHYYNYTTLSDWQTVCGLDLNSVFADPFFVQNPPLLPLNELINNIGADLLSSVPLDIEGNPRTTTPDPGAREFNPGCIPPVALSGVAVFESGVGAAVLSWTPQGEEDAWNIEYGPAGFVLGSGNSISVSENPYTLSGLQPLTNYDFYVQAVCEEGSTSAWAGPASFTTLAGQEEVACPPDVEICELNEPIALAGASPQGGTWSGNGVSGNLFSPAVAGPGVHTITYTFEQGSCEFTITVFEALPVSVSIVSSHSEICEGNLVAFTATPVNGGGSPAYQWMVNGNNAGTNSLGFSYAPENEDQISVLLTSSEACVSGNPSSSNTLTMTVHENPIVSWTWEYESVCIGVSQLSLTGGTPAGGTYSGPGVEGSFFIPQNAGAGTHTLTYTYTSDEGCQASAQVQIVVDECTGTPVISLQDQVKIYPNPASTRLFVEFARAREGVLQLVIFDLLGNEVLSFEETDPDQNIALDVSSLRAGIYFLRVIGTQVNFSRKILVN